MIIDQHIREQVLDVSQSFLVQAPAGSGKTSLLVQRFLSLLACVQQEPEEIVALTFTRKAAAEMRARILEALELGAQEQAPDDAYNNKLWQLARQVLKRDRQVGWDLLLNPMRLKIQTIDSLCASITSQMPIVSRFGAQPQIETKVEYLYVQAIDQLLAVEYDNDYWLPALNVLLEYLANDRNKFQNLMLAMLAKREQWLPILYGQQFNQDFRTILEQSLAAVVDETLHKLFETVPDFLDLNLFMQREVETLDDWLKLASILLTEEDQWRKQLTIREGFLPPSGSKDKQEKEQLKARKCAAEEQLSQLRSFPEFLQQLALLRKLPPQQYNDSQWKVIQALTEILPVLIAQLTLVFKEHGQVDFSEVSLTALRALGHTDAPSELSLALDCKIQHILVDEFQDTSLTQYKLLQHLTANWTQGDGKTLFLVGDPMQSIYRFRQADVGLFLQAKFNGINEVKLNFVQLQTNFRSTAPIVAWVNQVFSNSFPAVDDMTLGAISYMSAQAADDSEDPKPVACIAVDARAESAAIIEIIYSAQAQDPNQSIAILVRAKTQVQNLLPALRAAGIEYQGLDIESLAERPLIQDLLALTRAILHLDDRIAWLAILRAPWCGLSLIDLDLITKHDSTIAAALQDSAIMATLSQDAQLRTQRLMQSMLNAIRNLGRGPINNLVQTTWQQLGGLQCIRHAGDQQEAAAYFSLLGNIADQRDIFQISYLEQQLQSLFLPPLTTKANAVQIMTMHKAKGLEFDVVILPSLHKTMRGNDQQLLLLEQRQQHLLLAPIKAASEQEDSIYSYLAWCEKQRQYFDDLRLLYVATTRARRKIHCLAELGSIAPRSNSMLGKIWSAVQAQFESVLQPDFVIPGSVSALTLDIDPASTAEITTIWRLPTQWFKDNPISNTNLIFSEKIAEVVLQDWQRIAGIVMHRTLWQIATDGVESWDQKKLQTQELIWESSLRQLHIDPKHLLEAKHLIKQAIINMLADPWGRTVLSNQHPESYAEWRLSTHEYGEFKQVILDRAFLDQDGTFWLVDYKLIAEADELSNAIETYSSQLHKYSRIVQRVKPQAKIATALYFPLQASWQVISAKTSHKLTP